MPLSKRNAQRMSRFLHSLGVEEIPRRITELYDAGGTEIVGRVHEMTGRSTLLMQKGDRPYIRSILTQLEILDD